MKNKTIEKLRRKAIHALGGYTAIEANPAPQPVIKQYEKIPLKLTAHGTIRYGSEILRSTILNEAMHKIAVGIFENGLYTLREEKGAYGTELDVTVEILPPMNGW